MSLDTLINLLLAAISGLISFLLAIVWAYSKKQAEKIDEIIDSHNKLELKLANEYMKIEAGKEIVASIKSGFEKVDNKIDKIIQLFINKEKFKNE